VPRWISNVFCALSLVVFVLTTTIWVRSWFVEEVFLRVSTSTDSSKHPSGVRVIYGVGWQRGQIGFARKVSLEPVDLPSSSSWHYQSQKLSPLITSSVPSSQPHGVDIRFGRFHLMSTEMWIYEVWIAVQGLNLPLWLFLPTAIPPLLWWRRHRRRNAHGFPIAATSPAADSRPQISPTP
jgi:hypothetical protein